MIVAFATNVKRANATVAAATIELMNELEIQEFRKQRLSDAIDQISNGDKTAFGRKLGYKDGAFVRQMVKGTRAISEKTIRAIEAFPGMKNWFAIPATTIVPSPNEAKSKEADALWVSYRSATPGRQALIDYILQQRSGSEFHFIKDALDGIIRSAEKIFPIKKKRAG